MKSAPIHLPVFQKFDCQSCGHCCRNLVVNVTSEEQQRILEAGWAARIPGELLFIPYRFRGRRWVRLAHRADGACIFLGENGLCRLHAETGVHIKPLACRMYPFVPTPGDGAVHIDMRADCPSVAANRGRPLTLHQREIAGFVEETCTRPMYSRPEWRGGRPLTSEEFEAVVSAFLRLLGMSTLSFRDRLFAGCGLLDLLYEARVEKVRNDRFVEMMTLLSHAIATEAEEAAWRTLPSLAPRTGRLFRQWLFLHAIVDDPAELAIRGLSKYRRSWTRYGQSRLFAAGTGAIPQIRPDWPASTFEAVKQVGSAADTDLEPLVRSMQLKLDAHAFCGPGYYGYNVLHGLTALWLLPSVAGWFARLKAVEAGHEMLTGDDVLAGLRVAHYTFGVSPVFARISERLRLRAFARPGVPLTLMVHYGP